MKNVLLIQPPVSFTNKSVNLGDDTYPIGLSYLSAMLNRQKVSFRTINNARAIYSIEDIVNLCEAEKFSIVGISAVTPVIRSAVKLAKALKNRFNDRVHILLGNSHIAVDPTVINRYPYFDSAIDGEAEFAIIEQTQKILNREKVVGIFKAKPPKNLDDLPFPLYQKIENTIFKKGDLIPILGTRGCPYACGYCARQALSNIVRIRSAQNIVDEMFERSALTNRFFFNDDSATINKNYVISLCNLIIAKKMRIKFQMITRLDLLDDKTAQLLKKAGCVSLLVGIESGNERIRNEVIQKNLSDEMIFSGMAFTKKHNIPVQLFFMIGHPEETVSDIMESIAFPLKLEKMGFNNIECVGYHTTVPLPGTRYFDWCIKKGKISPSIIDDYIQDKVGDGFYGFWPHLIPDGLTSADLSFYTRMMAKRFYLRPSYIFRRLLQDLQRPGQLIIDLKNAYYVVKQGTSFKSKNIR